MMASALRGGRVAVGDALHDKGGRIKGLHDVLLVGTL